MARRRSASRRSAKSSPIAGAEVAGPLPADVQFYSVSAAAIAAGTKDAAAAKAVIAFLTAPAAETVLKAKGLSPVDEAERASARPCRRSYRLLPGHVHCAQAAAERILKKASGQERGDVR